LSIRASLKKVLELEADLNNSAQIEPGELTFDRELKMVRRKKAGAG
jgi:hypothetical protein